MCAVKLFWSWQSDTHQDSGRYFVRDVLVSLAEELNSEAEEAERPDIDPDDDEGVAGQVAIDHDTLDVGGSPRIADTILRKIREAAVFVVDVTPVAKTAGGKFVSNPNVMIELGYALRVMEVERIVLVMNLAENATRKRLPFDLRHWREPVSYSLKRDATEERKAEVAEQLKEGLRFPVQYALKKALQDQIEERRRTVREPNFSLSLDPDTGGPWLIDQNVEELGVSTLAEIRTKNPLLPSPPRGVIAQAQVFRSLPDPLNRRPTSQWTSEEVKNYNSAMGAYYKYYETYLDNVAEFRRLEARTIEVKLQLYNDGTAPGTDIDVVVTFPRGIVLYGEGERPEPPKAPEPPPKIPLGIGQGFARPVVPSLPNLTPNFLRLPTTLYDLVRREVRFKVPDLKHHHVWTAPTLLIAFATSADIQSFEMDYTITANEPIAPVTGTVRFQCSLVET